MLQVPHPLLYGSAVQTSGRIPSLEDFILVERGVLRRRYLSWHDT